MTARASAYADVGTLTAIRVRPPMVGPVGTAPVPGSKSLTNRGLLLAALAEGTSVLTGALDADDTRLMTAALRRCGVEIATRDDATTVEVTGLGGGLASVDRVDTPLEVGASGTVARFLGAVVAASPDVVADLDGTARMRERPLGQLFDGLVEQGGDITSHGIPGNLPATIRGAALSGGEVVIDAPASSQIVSGLVFAALLATSTTRIVLTAGTPARPYVDMTLATVRAFGGAADWVAQDTIEVVPATLTARVWTVEPDASAATYVWGLAALHGGDLVVKDLGRDSLQGDVAFVDVLARMGADVEVGAHGVRVRGSGQLQGVDVDLTEFPDPGLTLAAMSLHATGPTRIRGVEVHRHHETDRIAAAATELRKFGAEVVEHDGGLDIMPPTTVPDGVVVDTYDDHRMAMAFSLAGDVTINDPGCVAKTWPGYFAVLDGFGMVGPPTGTSD